MKHGEVYIYMCVYNVGPLPLAPVKTVTAFIIVYNMFNFNSTICKSSCTVNHHVNHHVNNW